MLFGIRMVSETEKRYAYDPSLNCPASVHVAFCQIN